MEKICRTCKWFNFGVCNNEDSQKATEVDIQIESEIYLEEGYVEEYVKENADIGQLSQHVIDILNENGYINKRRKAPIFEALDTHDTLRSEVVDLVSDVVNNLVLKSIKDLQTEHTVDENYSCKYWE